MATPPPSSDPSILATHTTDPSHHEHPSHQPETYTYYHAGPLFTLAELHTNALLASAISSHSHGKFIPVLPQDLEQRDLSPHSIRDEDLRALLSCDLGLFTYDGAELDAGTVVEYMAAKMADIPAVVLRTDFRGAGDQGGKAGSDAWNLMSSNWPRTVGVRVDSMVSYKAGLARALEDDVPSSVVERKGAVGEGMIENVAEKVVAGFEAALKEQPRLPKELRGSVYEWLALMPGFKNALEGGGEDEKHNVEMFGRICKDKAAKGLL